MKLLLTLVIAVFGMWAVMGQETKLPDQKLDMKEVEKLLQQIEAEENKIKPTDDATVSESLQKLFTSFRQVTSAYINVLNAVNKSLGLPKYPKLPGLSRQARQSQSMPLKQIQENLSQLQETFGDVRDMVRRVVSTAANESRTTVINQFRKFTDMWSKQLTEISNMFDNAMNNSRQADKDKTGVFSFISNSIQQVTRDIQRFVADIAQSISNQVRPNPNP